MPTYLARAEKNGQAVELARQVVKAAHTVAARDERLEILRKVAQALALAGELDQALWASADLEDVDGDADELGRVWVLTGVAEVLAVAERTEQALAAAHASFGASGVLGDAAEALADRGAFNQALALVEAIEEMKPRGGALLAITAALTDSRWRAQTARFVSRIRAIADTMTKGDSGKEASLIDYKAAASAFSAVALAHALAGESEEALSSGEHALAAAQAATIGLVSSTKKSALLAIAEALVRAGEYDRALAAAEAMPITWWRASNLLHVTQALAQAGQALRAAEAAGRVLTLAKQAVGLHTGLVVGAAAQALAWVGDGAAALRTALEIPDVFSRGFTLGDLAQTFVKTGNREQAARVAQCVLAAEAIWYEHGWAEAVEGAAAALAWLGDTAGLERMRDIAYAMGSDTPRDSILIRVARSFIRVGDINRARKIAGTIEDDDYKAIALQDIAGALAEVGDIGQALNIARAFSIKSSKASALSGVAMSLARRGDSVSAVQVATEALSEARAAWEEGDDIPAESAIADVTQAFAEAGVLDQAQAVAETISVGEARTRALSCVALRLVEAGRSEQALTIWSAELRRARLSSREDVFRVIEWWVPIVAELYESRSLADLCDTVLDVEGWWEVP